MASLFNTTSRSIGAALRVASSQILRTSRFGATASFRTWSAAATSSSLFRLQQHKFQQQQQRGFADATPSLSNTKRQLDNLIKSEIQTLKEQSSQASEYIKGTHLFRFFSLLSRFAILDAWLTSLCTLASVVRCVSFFPRLMSCF